MKYQILRLYSATTRFQSYAFYAYMLMIMSPPAYHLLNKVMNDQGGVISRFLPLSVSIILIVGHTLYTNHRSLKLRLMWIAFLYSYILAAIIAFIFVTYCLTFQTEHALAPALTGLIWLLATVPAAMSVGKYVRQSQ